MNRYSKTKINLQFKIERAKLNFSNQNLFLLISIILVLFIIGFPLLNILKNSFIEDGHLSVMAYIRVLTSAAAYKALLNTLLVSAGVLVSAGIMGGGLAFLSEKTDFRFKKLIRFLAFLEFCIPSYIISVSWIQITSRGGYLDRFMKLFIPDFQYTFNPYSLGAVMIVLSFHLYPLVFFGISNALRKSSGVLEDAGRVFGGTPVRVLKSISLPLVVPSFLSTGLLIFSRTMANFGIPAQLALPIGKEVLTTRIYKAISELDIPSLSVLSILLIAISYGFSFITEKWIRNHTFYSDSTESGGRQKLLNIGRKARILYPIVFLFYFIVLICPLITLILSSFMKRWGLKMNIKNMTIHNYILVLFKNDLMKRAFFNSLFYGILSASAAAGIAVVIVYYYRHVKSNLSGLLMTCSSLPLSVPNIILAVGAVFAWINPPLKLYGTKWIIILTYIVLFIPIITKQVKGLSENVNPAIDLSARTLRIPILRRILHLFFPQIIRGVISGWIISFLIAFREIPISLLLYSKGNETVGVLLFTIQSNSYGLEMTSTIAVFVIIISIIGNILVHKIGEKRL